MEWRVQKDDLVDRSGGEKGMGIGAMGVYLFGRFL